MPAATLNWQLASRAPAWSIIAAVVAFILIGSCVQLVAAPRHWFTPLAHATHGLIGGTLQASAALLVLIVGGVLLAGAGQTPRDFGWRSAAIRPAVAVTILLWAIVNLADVAWLLAGHQPLALHPSWSDPGVLHTSGDFIGQIFGNALAEETVFRGFLTVQMILLLRKLGGLTSMVAGVILADLIFTAPHVFLFMRLHIPFTELWSIFAAGASLAVLYLVTDNLFIAVGAHALSNFAMLVFTDPDGSINDHAGLIYIGLALVIAGVQGLRRPGGIQALFKRLAQPLQAASPR